MAIPEEVMSEFEHVRQHHIETYEAKIQAIREGTRRMREQERHRAEVFEAGAAEIGIDLDRLRALHQEDEDYIESYLNEIRPPLANRPGTEEYDQRGIELYAAAHRQTPGVEWAQHIGSYLLAPRVEDFEGIEGEVGNPYLFPKDISRLHIGQWFKGSGSGCFGGIIYSPSTAVAVFSYVPPKTGILRIKAYPILRGFYIVRADDGCWDCKDAKVWASLGITTFQNGYYMSPNDTVLIDYDEGNIDLYGVFDECKPIEFSRIVLAQAPLIIQVDLTIGTSASGGGSYAEVNFKTGANYFQVACAAVDYSP